MLILMILCLRWFKLKDGRAAEADDVLPDGHKLKKGDGVYYLAYGMGRMCSIWGEDAEEFRPERWLNNGVFESQSPFKFIAFHVCAFIFSSKLSCFLYSLHKESSFTLEMKLTCVS